ncbi:hypothetical protein NMG60_11002236 [Bertholletia excelsa]
MVPTLEAIKGGGGSIKVGTTGTIGALMSRELDSTKSLPQTPVSSNKKSPRVSILAPSDADTPKRLKPRTAMDEASSSNNVGKKSPETARKEKHQNRRTHQIPMINSDNISVHGNPRRGKRVSNIVEIVDIKCGNPDKAWAVPLTNRLKKLGFSKLSESIG